MRQTRRGNRAARGEEEGLAGIALRLGSTAVTPLVRKLFHPEEPGAGLTGRPVRLSALVTFRGEKRTLTEEDLRRLTRELVESAAASRGPHDPLPADEREALTGSVTAALHALHALGDPDMDDVQAVRLGHRQLAAALPGPAPGLSRDAGASRY
ncbi:hypothetical protein [Streptomyces sp. YIM 98790]|uniref:NACHT N-terminal Helical domain 1-containing protein n=1 Tax=Streptomyces sp. YIM 98790 TaxID=2689077 RepID=UPI00140DD91D|nr:hypothetical protein [Streptomyces sp. YIM 98790]